MFKVIVKDGRTQNLHKNMWAVNGDLEPSMFGPAQSTPLLEDGEYDANGFEFVLQMDNSKNVWVMADDPQYAMRQGWPTRHSLYFFKDNTQTPHIKTQYVSIAIPPEVRTMRSSEQLYVIDMSTLFTIFVAGFNEGSNQGPFPEHGILDMFHATIEGREIPGSMGTRYTIKDKIKPHTP